MCYETHLKLCFTTSDVFDDTPWPGIEKHSKVFREIHLCLCVQVATIVPTTDRINIDFALN